MQPELKIIVENTAHMFRARVLLNERKLYEYTHHTRFTARAVAQAYVAGYLAAYRSSMGQI